MCVCVNICNVMEFQSECCSCAARARFSKKFYVTKESKTLHVSTLLLSLLSCTCENLVKRLPHADRGGISITELDCLRLLESYDVHTANLAVWLLIVLSCKYLTCSHFISYDSFKF